MMELALVIALIGMLAAVVFPRVSQIMTRAGAGQATSVVATDLEYAVTLASRERKPVRVSCDCANGVYTVTDRATNQVLFRRRLGGTDGGLGLTAMTFSPATVEVFPSGLTSGTFTVTVDAAGTTRQVIMSSAGFVRVVR